MASGQDGASAPIVVGVDGSETSVAALRWAARQARLVGSRVEVVMAWHIPVAAYGYGVPVPAVVDIEADSKRVLEEVVKDVFGDQPDVEVSARVVAGPPAAELLEASASASLLVIGSRGHGAFTGMLLGSVSQHCAGHAKCPVVIVPHVDSKD